jgi:hypothetical protein
MIIVDVEPVDRAHGKRHQQTSAPTLNGWILTEADMADEPEDPDAAADRLEAALERIARLAAVHPAHADSRPLADHPLANAPPPDAELSVQEIAERLDSLIGRLRNALGKTE